MKTKTILTALLLMLAVGSAQAQTTGNWSEDGNRDTSWGSDYASASEFTITTPGQLAQFAYMVNNGNDFSGKTVTLDDVVKEIEWQGRVYPQPINYDGDLRDYYWTPIGTAEHPFNGTFNGNGKEVRIIINDSEATYQGFFGYIGKDGSVLNLVFDYGSIITGSTQVGTLAGYNAGTVQNCVVLNAIVSGTGYVGSIIGQNAGTATECYSINCGTTLALGAESSETGVDVTGHAERLWKITGDNVEVSKGTPTGTTVGSAVFYDDGIQYNYYHYYKTGATATVTYSQAGYNATFSVTGEGASINGNVVTMGTGDVTVSVTSTTVAEWSGKGTADEPYLIYNRGQLDKLAERVNTSSSSTPYKDKYFKLNDDLRYSDNNGDYVYHVIGTSTRPFCGVFDGNGKTISYASAGGDNESLQGLFGYIGQGGVVKNLGTMYCSFRGMNFIGVIAGDNAGTIENCRVAYESSGNVLSTQQNNYYGTIAGRNSGTIRNCVSAGSVKAYNNIQGYNVGGIVGHNTGTVENCLYLGSQLEGMGYVGAIVGHNEGTLTNNYYHDNGIQVYSSDPVTYGNVGAGTVKGVGTSGDVTGSDNDNAKKANVVTFVRANGSYMNNSDNISISGTPTVVTTNNPNNLEYSVYANGILFKDTYTSSHDLGRAFYTAASSVELTYTNVPNGYVVSYTVETGDNSSVSGSMLTIGDDLVEVSATTQRVATGWLADGVRAESFSTTGTNSITIMNAAELGLLAYNVNFGGETYDGYTITLGAAINLNDHTWEPIGNVASSGSGGYPGVYPGGFPGGGGYQSASGFLGTFDGAAMPIINLNVTGSSNVGLFSDVQSGAIVKNVFLINPQVKGEMYVGAIAGTCSGTIENCHISSGTVEFASTGGLAAGIGGIAGQSLGGSIAGCTATGTNIYPIVDNARAIGGIVGAMQQISNYDYDTDTEISVPATLKDCLFTGNIAKKDANQYVGAIAGMSQGSNTITNNYYVDGVSPYATPNTTLKGIHGVDVDGARLAIASDVLPTNIGAAGTQYAWSGVRPYANGLYYNQKYYLSSTAPDAMDITLSNDDDNTSLLNTYCGMTGTVTLGGRTFYKDGSWNTICLPFGIEDIDADDCPLHGDGVELWQLVETGEDADTGLDNEGILTLNFQNMKDDDEKEEGVTIKGKTTLIAGTPYLIRWTSASDKNATLVEPTFTEVAITKTAPKNDTFNGVTFVGTFEPALLTKNTSSNLYLGADNYLFYPETDGFYVKAFRGYFQIDLNGGETLTRINMNFGEDETSGITTTKSANGMNVANVWYSLDGRKLSGKPTKAGLYIVNGKKVNIK